jgi:hypothetical protein
VAKALPDAGEHKTDRGLVKLDLRTTAQLDAAVGAVDDLHRALRLARPVGHPVLVAEALLGLATVEQRWPFRTPPSSSKRPHGYGVPRRRATDLATTAE